MSDNSYDDLKTITDAYYAGLMNKCAKDILGILRKYKIKLRQKDGNLYSINVSIPRSRNSCILIGLRYVKKDKSHTEDHFLFEKGKSIVSFYKGKIEEVFPEYEGSHKQQIV